MLRPRITPCLLVRNGSLVKTLQFTNAKYVGDPINAVKIFNEKEVDELIVLDIDATSEGKEPDLKLIERLAVECRMPLCYGGGVKTAALAKRIIGLGVEKVAVSSAAIERPALLGEIGQEIGNQSVVAVLDVRKRTRSNDYEVYTHNGTKSTGMDVLSVASKIQDIGAGEIVINSIDADGTMSGYDLELAVRVREVVRIPLTFLGGAGSLSDVGKLVAACGVVGAAAGSFFVFKGAYKAVLITYPSQAQRESLIQSCLQ